MVIYLFVLFRLFIYFLVYLLEIGKRTGLISIAIVFQYLICDEIEKKIDKKGLIKQKDPTKNRYILCMRCVL